MGNCLASVCRRRRIQRKLVLLLIGLDNAGKTKTVNNLIGDSEDVVLPTVGFKAVHLVHKDTPVTIYDLGGGPQFRAIWSQYYSEIHGLIFVIDSSDYSRLDECKAVLEEVLSHDKISGKPVLVLANKQDKSGALDDIDVVEKLNIEPLVNKYRCPTLVESYTANPAHNKIDPALRKGYEWIINYIIRRYGDINLRVQTDIHSELERRKRQMKKLSSQASQTFTAMSDDIATQTGFENPNFTFKNTADREKDLETGIIIVQPITHNANSINSTMTLDSTDSSNIKPKLSPLFGRASNDVKITEVVEIELEPRTELRKLGPITRTRSGERLEPIDFKTKPQSSPTVKTIVKKTSAESLSHSLVNKEDSIADYVSVKVGETQTSPSSSKPKRKAPTEPLSHNSTHNSSIKDEDQKTDSDRSDHRWATAQRLTASANVTLHKDITVDDKELGSRWASAYGGRRAASAPRSRRVIASLPRRRHTLLFMQRNATTPQHATMLLYGSKGGRRRDKGDFEPPSVITD